MKKFSSLLLCLLALVETARFHEADARGANRRQRGRVDQALMLRSLDQCGTPSHRVEYRNSTDVLPRSDRAEAAQRMLVFGRLLNVIRDRINDPMAERISTHINSTIQAPKVYGGRRGPVSFQDLTAGGARQTYTDETINPYHIYRAFTGDIQGTANEQMYLIMLGMRPASPRASYSANTLANAGALGDAFTQRQSLIYNDNLADVPWIQNSDNATTITLNNIEFTDDPSGFSLSGYPGYTWPLRFRTVCNASFVVNNDMINSWIDRITDAVARRSNSGDIEVVGRFSCQAFLQTANRRAPSDRNPMMTTTVNNLPSFDRFSETLDRDIGRTLRESFNGLANAPIENQIFQLRISADQILVPRPFCVPQRAQSSESVACLEVALDDGLALAQRMGDTAGATRLTNRVNSARTRAQLSVEYYRSRCFGETAR